MSQLQHAQGESDARRGRYASALRAVHSEPTRGVHPAKPQDPRGPDGVSPDVCAEALAAPDELTAGVLGTAAASGGGEPPASLSFTADVGALVDPPSSNLGASRACEFETRRPHQFRLDRSRINASTYITQRRGHSSAGRALAWHARSRRFDPAWL